MYSGMALYPQYDQEKSGFLGHWAIILSEIFESLAKKLFYHAF